jgi:hypothetical protein
MPATALAAAVSEQYRIGVLQTREATAFAVTTAWASIDLDHPAPALATGLEAFRETAAGVIGSGQAAVAGLSGDYLASYLTAAGEDPSDVVLDVSAHVGADGDGVPLTEGLQAATTGLLWQLGRGAGRDVATQTGLSYAKRVAATAVVDSARDALTSAMQSTRLITGWRRLTSAQTCSRCADDAGHVHRPSYPLRSHPWCRCLAEPVVLGHAALQRAAPLVVRP